MLRLFRHEIKQSLRAKFSGTRRGLRRGPCSFILLGCTREERQRVSALRGVELRRTWRQLHEDLGVQVPKKGVTVYYLGSDAEQSTVPDFVLGILKGSRNSACWVPTHDAIAMPTRAAETLERDLVHELSHGALEHAGVGSRLPAALCEGYAMCAEDRFCHLDRRTSRGAWAAKGFQKACERGHLLSYTALCSVSLQDLANRSRYAKAVFYAQSLLLFKFVLSKHSGQTGAVLGVLAQASTEADSDPATTIAGVFGCTSERFAQQYWEFCRAEVSMQ